MEKKSLKLADLQKPRLKEVELSIGTVYFLPPSTKKAFSYRDMKNDGSEESLAEISGVLMDLVRDEQGYQIFKTQDDLMSIPTDVFMELSTKLKLLFESGSAGAPLGKTTNVDESLTLPGTLDNGTSTSG